MATIDRADAAGSGGTGARTIPLRGIRGTIARTMMRSLQTSAQLTLMSECDVTDLMDRLQAMKAGGPLSFTELLVPAVAIALGRHDYMNAAIVDDTIVLAERIAVGIAVATEKGLLVPVLHDADALSPRQVAERFRALAAAARAGTATPHDLTGGTFTITNLGAFGIDAFTPVLQPPQVGILGVGRTVERFVRIDGEGTWRTFVTLSLTFDHRAVDGAPAARFLATLADLLAQPAEWCGA